MRQHTISFHGPSCPGFLTGPHEPEVRLTCQGRAEAISRWLTLAPSCPPSTRCAYLNWADPNRRQTIDRKGKADRPNPNIDP